MAKRLITEVKSAIDFCILMLGHIEYASNLTTVVLLLIISVNI